MSFEDIVARIEALPADWHGSGPLSGAVLRTIAMYCSQMDLIAHSVETGAGKSTLFFSQVSQHLDVGALLIIDDINIPSMKRMTEILRKDVMFDCLETVGKTAFFRRTDAPLLDPLADGWWDQGYNASYLERTRRLKKLKEKMPSVLFNLIPDSLKLLVQKYL